MLAIHTFELVVFAFFAATVSYTVFFSIAGHFKKETVYPVETKFNRIAILIPAYKEDSVILDASQSMLALDYPKEAFEVFVVADQLKPLTIDKLKRLPLHVVQVAFEKSTKTKSLNFCLAQMNLSTIELILISDADNILEKSFLKREAKWLLKES